MFYFEVTVTRKMLVPPLVGPAPLVSPVDEHRPAGEPRPAGESRPADEPRLAGEPCPVDVPRWIHVYFWGLCGFKYGFINLIISLDLFR